MQIYKKKLGSLVDLRLLGANRDTPPLNHFILFTTTNTVDLFTCKTGDNGKKNLLWGHQGQARVCHHPHLAINMAIPHSSDMPCPQHQNIRQNTDPMVPIDLDCIFHPSLSGYTFLSDH